MTRPIPTALEALAGLLELPGKVDALAERLDRLAAATPAQEPAAAELPVYLSTEQAGKLCEVTPATVRSWVQAGHLRAYHAGRLLRVKRAELEAFLARGTAGGQPGDDQGDEDDVEAFVRHHRGRSR